MPFGTRSVEFVYQTNRDAGGTAEYFHHDVTSEAEWNARKDEWLPSAADRVFVASLMGRVVEPGKFANWIAPPVMGINRQPVDFEYVRFS